MEPSWNPDGTLPQTTPERGILVEFETTFMSRTLVEPWLEPCWNSWNLTSNHPCRTWWNPGGTFVEPYPGPPRSVSFSCWGTKEGKEGREGRKGRKERKESEERKGSKERKGSNERKGRKGKDMKGREAREGRSGRNHARKQTRTERKEETEEKEGARSSAPAQHWSRQLKM